MASTTQAGRTEARVRLARAKCDGLPLVSRRAYHATLQTEPDDATRLCDDPIEQALFGGSADDRTAAAAVNASDDVNAPASHFTLKIYFLIFLLGALAGLGPLAIDTYLPSFPAIAATFGTDTATVGRSLSAYFIGLALGQLIYGPAADRFGRKRPLYIGLVLFALASVGCALATSVWMLVIMRFVQALGGCAEMVIARAIVRDRFPPRDAIRVFSGQVLIMGVAPIIAPLLGGFIVNHSTWRTIFWVLAAASLLLLAMVAILLPESLHVDRRTPLSVGGTFSSFGRLLRDRSYMAYVAIASLTSAGLFAYVGGSSFVFIELNHISTQHFGWFFGANAAGLIGSAQINGRLVHRGFNPHRILTGALLVACIAGAVLTLVAITGVGGFPMLYAGIFVCLSSAGYIFPNSTVLAMAPHGKQAGNASALFGSLQFALSGLGGFAVSVLHPTTAIPMAATMAICAAAALFIQLTLGRPRPAPSPSGRGLG